MINPVGIWNRGLFSALSEIFLDDLKKTTKYLSVLSVYPVSDQDSNGIGLAKPPDQHNVQF
jgi:hypothetical protein